MNNSIKFSTLIDKLNSMIADLNIKISNDTNNQDLQNKLQDIINDKNILYTGTEEDLKRISDKYGE